MKLLELFEARRNPEQNPKTSINQIITDRLDATSSTIAGVPNLFVSFTSIDKLGINPGSKYDTPIGIYTYPAVYVMDVVGDKGALSKLPFAGNMPYVNMFSATGNIINVATMSKAEAYGYCDKIARYWSYEAEISDDEANEIIDGYIKSANTYANFPEYPGGVFWYVTMMVSKELLAPHYNSTVPIVWNKLFREIKIDGVVDLDPSTIDGVGIIHTNEASQAVFFSRAAITKEERHQNKYNPAMNKLKRKEGEAKHARTVAATADLGGVTDYESAVSFIKKHGDWAIRLIKNNDIKTQLLTKQPFLIGFLPNATTAQQITALEADSKVLKLIKRPDQAAIIHLLRQGLVGDITMPDIVTAVTIAGKQQLGPELQRAMVEYDDSAILAIPKPSREVVAFAVELASKKYHRLAGNNIPEDIAMLAIKYHVPYTWHMNTYHEKLKSQAVEARTEIAKLSLALEQNAQHYRDEMQKNPSSAQTLKLSLEMYKDKVQSQIDEIEQRIKRTVAPMLTKLDYLYNNSENGKKIN